MYNPNDYYQDCYFFCERKEMGATTAYCWLCDELKIDYDVCPCKNKLCDFYIPKKAADAIMIAVALDRACKDESQQKPSP